MTKTSHIESSALPRAFIDGLLEAIYRRCLRHEFSETSNPFSRQFRLPIRSGDIEIESGYLADIDPSGTVIQELKTVEHLTPPLDSQLLTYSRMSSRRIGRLINFKIVSPIDGIRRRVVQPRPLLAHRSRTQWNGRKSRFAVSGDGPATRTPVNVRSPTAS
jgi:GxxExxY protein